MRAAQLRPVPTARPLPTGTDRWSHRPTAIVPTPASGAAAGGQTTTGAWAEDLWTAHGRSVYSVACALLGDEAAAIRAVALGMVDLSRSDLATSTDDTARRLVRHVYRRSMHLTSETSTSTALPPAMVWLAQLAQLQRAALALCAFGGYSYTDAARLMEVTPRTVAQLLSSGLVELRRLAEPVIVT